MIGAFITFLVLFGLIKVFEKSRDDLDNFAIATVAIVPILLEASRVSRRSFNFVHVLQL